MSLWRSIASALIAAGMLAGLTAAGRADEPLKLRVGWAVVPAQLISVLFAKPELLKHYGKSYTVEAIHFRGSTPQITGLASGDLDLAALAFSSFALAIQNAHMQDIRAVSDLYQDAIPGYYSNQMMVTAGRRHQKSRGSEGQDRRHQCDRRRPRYRGPGLYEQARAAAEARLSDHRDRVPQHGGGARGRRRST